MFKRTVMATAAILALGISSPVLAGHHMDHGDKKAEAPASKDIVDVAASNDDFSTLVAAVKAADLVPALKGEGPFTVFAPNNAAFDNLPDGTVDTLLMPENKAQLQNLLKYHVVPAKVMAGDIAEGTTEVETLQGETIIVEKSETGVTIDGANVIAADIGTSNGVIHVIDAVVMP